MRYNSRLTFRHFTLFFCLLLCLALTAHEFATATTRAAGPRRAPVVAPDDGSLSLLPRALRPGAPSFLRVSSPLRALLFSGSPYTGTPWAVPGTIQAENFDHGGEGISYHDTTPANEGNSYRLGGVDITPNSTGMSVGWTQVGEWLEYTVNVSATSTYKIEVFAATPVSTGAVHVEVDGVNVTGNMPIPNTGGWGTYAAASKSGVLLTAGTHVLRVSIDGYGFLLDRVQVSDEQAPYGGTPWAVPGTIQAENFDNGGEGLAYHDTTTANEGGYYRTTAVDIINNPTGMSVGWTQVGEWLEYTINVSSTGTYTLQVMTATTGTTGTLHFEVDGVDVSGPLAVPNTGSWSTYGAVSKTGVSLTAGQHMLRVSMDGYGFLFDSINFIPASPAAPSGLTATTASPTQLNLSWTDNSSNETGFRIERKTGAGGTYAEVATVGAGVTTYQNTGLASNTQYFYRVRATNAGGDSAYSNEAGATTANQAPAVSLTEPAGGTSYTVPASVTLVATAADADGGVVKVEFYRGATKLGEDASAPYSYAWFNAPAGSYSLTARAIDTNGAQTTSTAVNITVGLPTVNITASDATASEQGPDSGTFTISRTGTTGAALTVNYTVSGTATAVTDYAAVGTSVIIPAGATSQVITVTPVDDAVVEHGGETVVLTLAANSAYGLDTPSNATINIADNDTTPPSVSLTAPSNGATFAAYSSINITANASDPDPGGSVAKVEFFQGATKLGEDTSAPYAFNWTNVAPGSYSLTAKATDNAGATTTSTAVNVTVSLPTVTISATDANASEQGPDDGTFTVSRTGGTVSALTVNYATSGTASNGTDYSTLSGSVVIPAGATSQVVTVTPVDDAAVENGGETAVLTLSANAAYTVGTPASATVNIVDNDTTPPSVSLTAPSNGTVYEAYSTVNLTANASDPDPGGSVTKVEFFQGATKLGEDTTSPFTFSWTNVAPGSYNLTAKATDNAGATATSAAVNITVSLPTVTVTATDATASEQGPDAGIFTIARTGGTVSALTVNYAVTGTAAGGSDYGTLSGSVTIPVGASSQTVTVTPVDDAAVEGGETVVLTLSTNAVYTVGTPASATVNIADNDNTPPSVSLTAPTGGAVFEAYSSINLTANASDPDPGGSVTKVEFFQGATKLGEDTSAPYAFNWTNVAPGSYSLTAKATDNTGLTATSAAINISVSLPAVTVSATDANASEQGPDDGTFTVSRTGGTVSALTVNYATSGTASNGTDYSTLSGSVVIPAGATSQVVTVTPVDDAAVEGGEAVVFTLSNNAAYTVGTPASATVNIADNDSNAPTVSITSPAGDTVYTVPTSIEIDATAADADGTVAKVEFFQGATKLGEDTSAPYSYTWVNPAAGSYSLTAKAIDNTGATGTSAAVSVVVNTQPSVSITSPAHNSAVGGGASVQITAAASDPDQGDSVTKVEFYAGATKLGEDTSAPYSFTWQNVPEGTHLLTAVATDTREASATSALVSVSSVNFDMARLDPENRTGVSGVDPYSRNFNWSHQLVSLPGRAGLDLGLTLSYNSLVWTKSGNYVLFNGDGGWPAPGFRLGFPTIQGQFYDTQAQKAAYMMISPTGARVSLRYVSQTGTTTTYETGDSSNLRLTEEAGILTLVAPGGTRMRYEFLGGVFQCTEITDRNGNFITVAYNPVGNLQTVTDTLGRVITFTYDAQGYLKEITQTWHREVESGSTTQTVTETHYWARFEYDNKELDINFEGLTPLGAQDEQTVRVLKRMTLADDSYYVFNYTTWGQVYQVANYAKDNGLLNYVTLGLPLNAAQPQGDCPRVTERRLWAAYWNGDTNQAGAAAEEAVTTYEVTDGATWQNPESNLPETGRRTVIEVPGGTINKEYAHTTGWDEGLTRLSEFWSGGKLKKQTSTAWTQDDENVSYKLNPRVKETNVYDFNANETLRSRRRTEFIYTLFGLPQEIREYADNATTVMRRTHTEYVPESVNANGAYTLLRIIGLPKERKVYGLEDGQEKLASKHTFYYDGTDTTGVTCLENAGTVTQHKAEYGLSFNTRGNLCLGRRWDVSVVDNVSNADDVTKAVPTWTGFSTTGSVLFTMDALGHKTSFSYAGPNGAGALGYPTTTTDPEGHSATLEYNYDTGATTRKVDLKGAAVKTFYDPAGRTLKTSNEVNGAYTKWEYGANGLYAAQKSLVDAGKPETFVMNVTDGAGRARATLSDHPTGGTGYAANRSEYDKSGRLTKLFSQVEVTVNPNDLSDVELWVPTGIDSTPTGRSGWPRTETVYDWNGRVTREINADGTDRLRNYEGCGCAGNDVMTTQGELLNIPGTSSFGRRTKRVHHDPLGREIMSEVLDWYGATYATTTTRYNALDKAVRVRQYKGGAPATEPEGEGPNYQTTTMSYDGHGRLQSQHRPEQMDANGAPLYTTYQYYDDDNVAMRTDARGATTTYTYNKRHQVKLRDYNVPASGTVATTPDVGFGYDAAGNRLWMTDGAGRVDYVYDTLSRMTSEKRTYNTGQVYELKYEYNLADKLTKLTDPQNASVNYEYNRAGQLLQVTGADYGATAPLLTDISYRAWGDIKHLKNGDSADKAEFDLDYDMRMRLTRFEAAGRATEHEYYDDGRPRYVRDLHYTNFNRTYVFDHAGQLMKATAGESTTWQQNPYSLTYGYDEYGHSTTRSGTHWSRQLDAYAATYVNNRNTQWHYDADGHEQNMDVTPRAGEVMKYDAEGRLATDNRVLGDVLPTNATYTTVYDGDGKQVRSVSNQTFQNGQHASDARTHYVYSTVLDGSLITEFWYKNDATGVQAENPGVTRIYAGGREIAYKRYDYMDGSPTPWLYWVYHNPVNSSRLERQKGDVANTYEVLDKAVDPLGGEVFFEDPYVQDPPPERPGNGSLFSDMEDFGSGCFIEGAPAPCGLLARLANTGALTGRVSSPTGIGGLLDMGLSPFFESVTELVPNPCIDCTSNVSVVTTERLRFQFLGFMNRGGVAQQSQQQQTPQDRARELLRNPECGNFIAELIYYANTLSVESGSTLKPSFEPLMGSLNGDLTPSFDQYYGINAYDKAVTENRVTATGTSGAVTRGNVTTTTYGTTTNNTSIKWNNEFYTLGPDDAALQVIHESLHLVPYFSDFALAGAAHILETRSRTSAGNAGSFTDQSAASVYLNRQIERHCRP